MIYSLGEIEVHARKAIRGAGFSWGHAEETGKAIRWLSGYGLPGAEILARYLQEREAQADNPSNQPNVAHGNNAKTGYTCPIIAAAQLMDQAHALKTKRQWQITRPASPLLLLPALCWSGEATQQNITLNWTGVHLSYQKQLLFIETKHETSLTAPHPPQVTITCSPEDITPIKEPTIQSTASFIAPEVWEALDQFARRTYVPASEASRKNAGPAD